MNATEARKIAKSFNTSENSGQYKKILDLIKSACDRGEYEVWVYEPILKDVEMILKKEGYNVGALVFDRGDSMQKISW